MKQFKPTPKTIEKIKLAQKLRNKRLSYSKIGKILGVSRQRIHQWLTDYRTSIPNKIKEKWSLLKKKRCEICNKKTKTEIHHINGNREHNGIDNLISVCHKCHLKLHKKLKKEL